jgi:Cu/Ag efflux protein CusF
MKTLPLLIAFCFTLLTATPAAAKSPRGTHITGTIQKVDASTREVELLQEDTRTPITFVWNRLTTFVTGTSMADAAILKKGARVEIILHRPFFGKPFVAKVTLLPATVRNVR